MRVARSIRPSRRFLVRRASALLHVVGLFGAAALSAQDRLDRGPISRVDHFFAESGSMEALLDFLKDDLRLPEAWADQDYGVFATGAVSLGNVVFEVVRFPETDRADPARFAGVALEPDGDTQGLLAWMSAQGVVHGTPERFPPEGPAFFENTPLPGLIPGGANVFVCDYKERQLILEGRAESRALLEQREGGPLGLLGVEELLVESTDLPRSLRAWSAVVPGTRSEGEEILVEFDDGPRIRIRSGESDRFAGISLLVRSLDEAGGFLESRGLLGPLVSGRRSIAPEAVGGLVIVITGA